MASYFYSHQGEDALGHLCRVLSGLDSMVLGETEIFGQVKTAYHTALDAGITAACANKTFQKAFTIGKKVRTESQIHAGATSVDPWQWSWRNKFSGIFPAPASLFWGRAR